MGDEERFRLQRDRESANKLKRALRKIQIEKGLTPEADSEPTTFDENSMSELLESQMYTSNTRFVGLQNPERFEAIDSAIDAFSQREKLEIKLIDRPEVVPRLPAGFLSKYDDISDVSYLFGKGEKVWLACVFEEGFLVGFSFAVVEDAERKIDVVSVDELSRRSAGLEYRLMIGSEPFSVGIGHVAVKSLLSVLPRPIWVDAVNPESQYIFSSLGFIHDERAGENPCILRLE